MTDPKPNEARLRETPVENDGRPGKAQHLDAGAEAGKTTVPANEETEGATKALEAPPSPPEMAKEGKNART